MIRLLRSAKQTAASMRYVTPYVRGGTGTGVVNTEPQEEGIYYQYIYTFDNIPEMFGRYQDKYHNAYLDKPLFEGDNWEFEYHGQWWDIGGSRGVKYLYMLMPFLFWIDMEFRENSLSNKRGFSLKTRSQFGPFMKYHPFQEPKY